MMRHRMKRGFTLVEIILVIIIIGILAAIIVPKFAGQTDKAKIATTKANINSIRSAIRLFQSDNDGTLPTDLATDLVPTYLRAIPEEAITEVSTVVAANDGGGGWVFDGSGSVSVNLGGSDVNGDLYSSY